MAGNTFAPGKSTLVEPPRGSYSGTWDSPVNSNWGLLAATLSGTTNINAASIQPGNPYVVLTFENFDTTPTPLNNLVAGQNIRIQVTGALLFDISIKLKDGYAGTWIIDNRTSGNFKVNVLTTATGSVGIQPAQGYMTTIFCDGTNVYYSDLGSSQIFVENHVKTGTIILYGSATVQNGYLLCNGAAISRTAYADLFSKIGTGWGAGDGVTTFNVPNLTFGTSPGTYMIKT